MILQIGDKTYPAVNVDELSLKHTLVLQRELTLTGISSAQTWGEVRGLVREFAALTKDEQKDHPEGLFLTALVVWAAKVTAGEDVTLLEAADVPVTAIRFIAEPHDRKPAEVKTAGKGKGGTARRR